MQGGTADKVREEVHDAMELQVIDEYAATDGAYDDGCEVGNQRTCTKHLADDEDGGHVTGRTRHQQDQSRTRREPFQDQCHSDRYGARRTEIHGYGDADHQQHGGESVPLEDRESLVRHEHRDESRHDESDHQPLADVLHHLLKGIDQRLLYLPAERGIFMGVCAATA